MFSLEAFLPADFFEEDGKTLLPKVEQLSNLLELIFSKIKKPSSAFYSKISRWVDLSKPLGNSFEESQAGIETRTIIKPLVKRYISDSKDEPQSEAVIQALQSRKIFTQEIGGESVLPFYVDLTLRCLNYEKPISYPDALNHPLFRLSPSLSHEEILDHPLFKSDCLPSYEDSFKETTV